MKSFDFIIIGGGASGLIAALQASQEAPDLRIAILERLPRPGKKLLITGNGRCNIANINAERSHYFNAAGQSPAFVEPALLRFSQRDNLAFFRELGLLTKEEEAGKIYPLGDQAAAVLDTLRLHIAARGISLYTECEALALDHKLALKTSQGELRAGAVLLAAGGMASPQVSNAAGLAGLAEPLGHRLTKLYPALTQLKCSGPLPKALQGIKVQGVASLWENGREIAASPGEILFAAYGLSGPAIFQLSRLASCNFAEPSPLPQEIRLDLLPAFGREEIIAELKRRRSLPLSLEDGLSGLLNKRLGQQLLKAATGLNMNTAFAQLTEAHIQELARLIKALPLSVSGTMGWEKAQVTAGGLELKGFDAKTLASRRIPGLFAAGEALDICGDCGGYNLSWAWSSGRLAAHSAVKYIQSRN